MKRFREGLVFKAHRLLYHATLGLRVIKKKVGTAEGVVFVEVDVDVLPESARVVVPAFGSCVRRIVSCITQLKAQGLSRSCNESKEEEEEEEFRV